MSAKKGKRKIETKTVLYILLVLVIICGAYVFISSQEEPPTYYDPIYVLENEDRFMSKNILIEGYYDENVGIASFPESVASGPLTKGLGIDPSNLDNDSKNNLTENRKLYFAGHLEYIDPDNVEISGVVFILDKVTLA